MDTELTVEWEKFGEEDSYAYPGEMLEEFDYELVESNIIGEWRWGNINEDIWKSPAGTFVVVKYHDASGDGEVDHGSMMAEFYEVEPQQITITKYVKI